MLPSQASPETFGDEQTIEVAPSVVSLSSNHTVLRWGAVFPFYRPKLRLREVGSLGEGNTTASGLKKKKGKKSPKLPLSTMTY